jgi:hypothetical protein
MGSPIPPATPTPPQYMTGWVKQDLHKTWAVAVRTGIVTANNAKDWGIMTVDRGGHYGSWDEVSSWPDISEVFQVGAAFHGGDGVGGLSATVVNADYTVIGDFTGGDGAGGLSATASGSLVRATNGKRGSKK